MRYAADLDGRDRRAGKRRKNDPSQRIAERVAVSRVQTVNLINTGDGIFGDYAGL